METGGTRISGIRGREGREASQRSRGRGATSNDSGSRIPNGEAPGGGSPRASGNGTRPSAFLGDTRGGVACGVCGITLQPGHRAVRFPCGQGRHLLHARRVVEALARGAAPALLRCLAVNCEPQHPRRDALEAAVQAAIGPEGWEGDHRRRGPTQQATLVRMRSEQPGYRAATRCRFDG